MKIFENEKAGKVFDYFSQLCTVPHGSGNTKQISDLCCAFAREQGLEYYQDELNNVVIIKEASPGYEAAPAVILQGHLDMVCAKTAACTKNMEKEGIDLALDGDWLHAVETSMGGDNGLAVAMVMAILADNSLVHPRIEAVMTVDEEVGMEGAFGLDVSMLKSKMLINLDSEDEGVLTVSCAGGVRAACTLPVERTVSRAVKLRITVGGLKGGHSGVEIDKGRGNSNQLTGRLLRAIRKVSNSHILSMTGGKADNIITNLTVTELAVSEYEVEKVIAAAKECEAIFKAEYSTSDPDVCVTVEDLGKTEMYPLSIESTDDIIHVLLVMPGGIQAMSMDVPGLVQTSLNLGILELEDDALRFSFAVRSSVESQKTMVTERIESVMEKLGGTVSYYGDYPGWAYMKDSKLRELCVKVFNDMYGRDPEILAIHAGLECGLFSGKIPGLDCVSFGPDLKNVHSVDEKVSVTSVKRVYEYLVEIIKNIR